MGRAGRIAALVALALIAVAACTREGEDARLAPLLDPRAGGETTAPDATTNAFGLSARNLARGERRIFEVGDSFFTQKWVIAPASTGGRDGLGPLFNAASCASCHVLDGRARPPEGPDDPTPGLLLRLGVPGPDGQPVPHPVYGGQLQDDAIPGVAPEGRIAIRRETIRGRFGDGTPYTLERPSYAVADPGYGPLGRELLISPRIAPQVVGMGLLEAIPEESVLAAADPDDRDGDGISGRARRVVDPRTGAAALGRFGWRAGAASVESQAATAFAEDIGITSPLVARDGCSPSQRDCRAAPDGGSPELTDEQLARVAFYVQTLAVPAPRDLDDPQVRAGAGVFIEQGCGSCHTVTLATGEHPVAAVSGQTIHPYTDLLLHDLGPGLADDLPEGEATAAEWRTPPLWGIGLVEAVNGHTRFLHDGRARNLGEAILWHGGEARRAREAYRTAPAGEREALLAFLRSR